MRQALIFIALVFALTACGKQRVATQPDVPPLAPPPPPPRVVAPPETAAEPPATAPEPDRNKPARRQPARTEPPRETPAKPEAPPKTPAPPPPPTREDTPPPTTLQTVTPANQAQMEREARALLAQAKKDLGNLKPASMNADGRGQYDTARRFVEQSEQALKEQNFVLARQLADKAATIAAVLAGR